MANSTPNSGNPVFDVMIRASDWLGTWLNRPFMAMPLPAEPSAMTGAQLREAIFRVNHDLADDTVGPWLVRTLGGRPVNDPRLRPTMPASPRMHVLLGFASAHDSANLAATGLQLRASAATLAPIRTVAETFVRLSWMLDTDDDRTRMGRAYGLTQADLDAEQKMIKSHKKAAKHTDHGVQDWVPALASANKRSRAVLAGMTQKDQVDIEQLPPFPELSGRYMTSQGGYSLFSLLPATGVHASTLLPFLFYGPGEGATNINFDFHGMHNVRAYWMSAAVGLHIDLARLVAPELGWPGWDPALSRLRDLLAPLASEAEKRYMVPLQDFLGNLPSSSA